jgi:hypothetical protein
MVQEAIDCKAGIKFTPGALDAVLPRPGDPDPDVLDATQPIHDDLASMPLWWILEILPLSRAYQDARGYWHRIWR